MTGAIRGGWCRQFVMFLLMCMNGTGCAVMSSENGKEIELQPISRFSQVHVQDLAGAWEFVAGDIVYALFLNHKGNGTYEWKDGQFETTGFADGIWSGTWQQLENDREGGFELHLAEDVQTAQGEWWYTRIGKEHDPLEPGGTFTLRRSIKPTNPQ